MHESQTALKTLPRTRSRPESRAGLPSSTQAGIANAGRRHLILGGGAGLALPIIGLAGCATRQPDPRSLIEFAPPRVEIGDRWIYLETNRYNNLPLANVEVTVTAKAPLTCSVRRTRSDSTAGEIARRNAVIEEVYASPWTVSHEPTYDVTMDFVEPMPLLPATLRVGEKRHSKTRYTVRGYSGSYRWQQYLEAMGVERVVTPAGSFECLRVRRMIWFDYPDVFRFNSSRVDTAWYATEVNRWVRREWTGDYQHESFLGEHADRLREDWVRWDLLKYEPATPAA